MDYTCSFLLQGLFGQTSIRYLFTIFDEFLI